jgi:phosphoribosylformylglycinamidine synthase
LGRTLPELGGSLFADVVLGKVSGRPPALDLDAEAALQSFLVEASANDLLAAAHDCSDGGLAVALAECAIAGGTGFTVALPDGGLAPHVALFSESASRTVVAAVPGREGDLEDLAAASRVPLLRIGLTGGSALEFAGLFSVDLSDALLEHESAIPRLMRGTALAEER